MKFQCYILLTTLSLFGCASFERINSISIDQSLRYEKQVFNGEYEIELTNTGKGNLYSILEILDRENYYRPIIDTTFEYYLKIDIKNDEIILMSLVEKNPLRINSETLITKEIKIKAFENNYIYLDNNNIKWHNIPFIFGGCRF